MMEARFTSSYGQAMLSRELSDDYIAAVYIYCNTGRRHCRCICKIKPVAIYVRRFSRTPSGIALNFQAASRLDHRLLA